jgi:hypothetical protein
VEATSGFSKPETWKVTIPFADGGEQHLGVMKNFARAIVNGEPLLAPAGEGIQSVELANAMLLSGELGEEVTLPMDGARYEALLNERISKSKPKKWVAAPRATSPDDFARSF